MPSAPLLIAARMVSGVDRKSTRLNSSHSQISYAVFCLKKKKVCQSKPSLGAPVVGDLVLICVTLLIVLQFNPLCPAHVLPVYRLAFATRAVAHTTLLWS